MDTIRREIGAAFAKTNQMRQGMIAAYSAQQEQQGQVCRNADRHGWSQFLVSQAAESQISSRRHQTRYLQSKARNDHNGQHCEHPQPNGNDGFDDLCFSLSDNTSDHRKLVQCDIPRNSRFTRTTQPYHPYDRRSHVSPPPQRRYDRQGDHCRRHHEQRDFSVNALRQRDEHRREREREETAFCIDRVGGEQGIREPIFVRTFKSALTEIDEAADESRNSGTKAASYRRSKAACFNCMETDHMINECPHPKDKDRIQQNRCQFLEHRSSCGSFLKSSFMLAAQRYHGVNGLSGEEIGGHKGLHGAGGLSSARHMNRFAQLKPGLYTTELRKALGINDEQLPSFTYQMRLLGYPPGWLMECAVYRHSKEDGNSTTKEEYDFDQLVTFPGFNVAPDPSILDESQLYGTPEYNEQLYGKESFIQSLLNSGCSPMSSRKNSARAYEPDAIAVGEGAIIGRRFIGDPEDVPMDIVEEETIEEEYCDQNGTESISDGNCTQRQTIDASDEGVLRRPTNNTDLVSSSSGDDGDPKDCRPDTSREINLLAKKDETYNSLQRRNTVVIDSSPMAGSFKGRTNKRGTDTVTNDKCADILRQDTVELMDITELARWTEECLGSTDGASSTLSYPSHTSGSVGDSIGESDGTPIAMSSDVISNSIPSLGSFALGINEHRFYENLPGCTGNFARLMGTLKKQKSTNDEVTVRLN